MEITGDFIVDFIHNSNAIEGIVHSKELIRDVLNTYQNKNVIDLSTTPSEIRNTLKALEYIYPSFFNTSSKSDYDRFKNCPCLKDLLRLHELNSAGLQKFKDEGRLRRVNVMVGGRLCPRYDRVPFLIVRYFEEWNSGTEYTFLNTFILDFVHDIPDDFKNFTSQEMLRHLAFEYIHPFSDGNGRVGRLLYLWDCLNKNVDDFFMIEAKERWTYYGALEYFKNRIKSIGEI